MFTQLKKIEGNILAVKITGEILEREHHQLDRLIRESIAEWKRIRIFLVLEHYATLNSAEALYDDMRMIKKHAEHIDRLAVVADRVWKRTWIGLFGLFSGIETEFFEMEQIETANQWIIQNP